MSAKGNELVVLDNYAIDPETITQLAETLRRELSDLGPLDLPRASAPTGAGLSWLVKKNADDTDPESVKALEGVIIARHRSYAYYANAKVTPKTRPQCSSRDGIHGVTIDGDVVDCATCPYNQYGTAVDASGAPSDAKACKQAFIVYLLREGDVLPTRVKIPPTGVRRLGNYLKDLLVPRAGKPMLRGCDVVTRISFTSATSKSGTQYAAPVFETVGILPAGVGDSLEQYGKGFLADGVVPDDVAVDDGDVF